MLRDLIARGFARGEGPGKGPAAEAGGSTVAAEPNDALRDLPGQGDAGRSPASPNPGERDRFGVLLPGVALARKITLDPGQLIQPCFDAEPARITAEEFRTLLLSCVLTGASDVTLQTGRRARAEIDGQLHIVTRRSLGASEIDEILIESYGGPARGAHARTEINSREVLDYSYELVMPDDRKQRFRVNATGIHAASGSGVELTFRALPQATPSVGQVGLSGPLLEAMTPRDGLAVVAGATGHGKSTTLAAVVRQLLEDQDRPVKIVDIEAPVEFSFEDIWTTMTRSTIGQSEVGRHIASFAEGVRSALRRKPHVIVVGEARDHATISASLEASITGHLVYTTTHAGTVPDVIRRLLSIFGAEEREARAHDLASSLRLMMVQALVPRVGGGRIPVREYLIVSREIRDRLLSMPSSQWASIVVAFMDGLDDPERGQTMAAHAGRLHSAGLISARDCRRLGGPGGP